MARKRLVEAVWERTTRLLRDGAGRIAPVALAAIFLPQWLSGIATALGAEGGVAGSAWNVLGLALTLVTFWAQLVLIGYAVDGDRTAAVRRASARFLPVVGISLLLLLGVAVLALPVAGILAANGVDLTGQTTTSPSPAAVAWVGLYLLVLAPVLLWLFARLLPLSAVALFERRGLGAFARAFALTRGAGAALFGTLLLYMVVVAVTVPAVRSVAGVVFTLLFGGGEGGISVAGVLTAGVVALATTGFAVLQAVFTGTLYAALAAPPAGLATDPTPPDGVAAR